MIHGDEFDVVVRYAKWLAFLGDRGYELALWMNNPLELRPPPLRARLLVAVGAPEAARQDRRQLHRRVREGACPRRRAARGVDGVICGHIHHAASRHIGDIHYLNTGDWVESCTAIGENEDGSFELIRWLDVIEARRRKSEARLTEALQVA